MEGLVKDRVIDAQSRDETRNQCRAAEAALEEADARAQSAEAARAEAAAKRDKADADLAAACNRLALAESNERRMRAMLAYARITAPFDGVVTDRRVHTGHFLQSAAGGSKGEPLFVVVRTDRVRVFVEVPEADASSSATAPPAASACKSSTTGSSPGRWPARPGRWSRASGRCGRRSTCPTRTACCGRACTSTP
jgi:multidrug efflux pump subunit AcrA (membrane-fusion protein)